MARSLNVVVPVLVALGLLDYHGLWGELGVARAVGVVLFLVIAAAVAAAAHRPSSKR